MSNKRQTAVDWFIQEIEAKGDAWENVSIGRIQISIDVSEYIKLKSQAKEMDKEQIVDAIVQHQIKHHDLWGEKGILQAVKQAEQYYNETYNTPNP